MDIFSDSSPLSTSPEDGRPLPCEHEQTEPRMRTLSNGARAAYWQCLACGSGVRAVGKGEHRARYDAQNVNQPFDLELRNAWDRHEREAWEAWRRQRERDAYLKLDEESRQWWDEYNAYLATEAWRRRSRMRLELDHFVCHAQLAGCTGHATQAHHLTYKHLRNEPLFELISVCPACHDAITAMDRAKRAVV